MPAITRRFLAILLPTLTAATLVAGLALVAVQQDLRQGADDPQHQLAEDAVARLDSGVAPSEVPPAGSAVDLATSLAPFVAVYDTAGQVLASDAVLDGRPPMPPPGVLTTAREKGLDAVTWQPRAGVRIALVVLPWHGGTVLAGKSLRRVESIESNLEGLAIQGWIGLTVAITLVSVIAAWLWPADPRALTAGSLRSPNDGPR